MKLDRLTGRDPQRPIGVAIGDLVEKQVLLRRQLSAGQACPQHELVMIHRPVELACVPILLLVDAVKFEKLVGGIAEKWISLGELLANRPAQSATLRLDLFRALFSHISRYK